MSAGRRLTGAVIATGLAAAACGNGPSSGGISGTSSSASHTSQNATGSCPGTVSFSPQVDDHGAAVLSGSTVSLIGGDSYFQPTCITGVAAGSITVSVRNTGSQLHNISVSDQNIDQDVAAGETVNVHVKVQSAPLVFFCKYHRASGMQGALLPGGA